MFRDGFGVLGHSGPKNTKLVEEKPELHLVLPTNFWQESPKVIKFGQRFQEKQLRQRTAACSF